jgi:hypothetical protein
MIAKRSDYKKKCKMLPLVVAPANTSLRRVQIGVKAASGGMKLCFLFS